MTKAAGILLALVLLIGQLAAARISLKNLDSLEDFAIHDRLVRTLAHQYTLWNQCPQPSQETTNKLWHWYKLVTNINYADLSARQQKDSILSLIQAIQETKNPPANCFYAQNARVVSSIRKNLVMPPTIKRDIYHFYKDLAPACFPVAGKGRLNNQDTNACFGADLMIVTDADLLSLALPIDSLIFAEELFKRIQTLPVGKSLDLFDVYAQTFTPDPQSLLTLLASFVTSGNSGLTGWLQGVEDTLLLRDLNDTALSKEKIYDRAKMLQEAKIDYQKFRELADRSPDSIKLFGTSVSQWNRHNFMAAYLGCREKGTEKDVVARVSRIGVGYESKDFASHILEGVSLKASVNNFKEDTQRYVDGATVGYQACHPLRPDL